VPCVTAKEFLSSHGIPYDARDVSDPGFMEELLQVTKGLRGVPVIVVGDQYVRGFYPDRVAQMLGLSLN
jgi:glutaredoxin